MRLSSCCVVLDDLLPRWESKGGTTREMSRIRRMDMEKDEEDVG